jgi:Ser/Thr protein kinase RdoA (MazF antagonist)
VLGIPGFESPRTDAVWQTPTPFERIAPATAIEIARDTFDLDVLTVARLETERDDTFRLRTPGRDLVLKIAHPGDDAASIDLQTKALLHAHNRDAALPLQRLLETPDGDLAPVLAAHENRVARLFTWLPGSLLVDASPNDVQLELLGEALGRLSTALRGFEHYAAEYPLAWDLAQAQKLRRISEDDPNASIAEVLDRHENVVVPLLDELPRQVIHNDFNPGNVVVDVESAEYVTGILDFGDVIQSIRVADLAVALSYLMYPLGRSWAECTTFIEGFERRVLLVDDERAVLRTLVMTRFVQRVLINDWLNEHDGGRAAVPLYRARLLETLDILLGGG